MVSRPQWRRATHCSDELDADGPPVRVLLVPMLPKDLSNLRVLLDRVHDVEIAVWTGLSADQGIDTPAPSDPHRYTSILERGEQLGDELSRHCFWV